MKHVRRHLILNKGDELFIYGYEQGAETDVLETLIAQAKDEQTDLNWFDVAVLESKLEESASEFQQNSQQGDPPPKSEMHNRFELPTDGPLWFMRGLFGPNGDRHGGP